MPATPKPKLYDPNAEENRYPKMVYPDDVPKAGTGKLVNSKDEHDALIAASAPPPAPEPDPSIETDEKDALLARATELGLELDRRSSVGKIKAAIADAEKKSG